MTYSALRVSVFVAAASAIIYGFSPQVFVYGKVSFRGTLFAMAGPPVTVYVMPHVMDGYHGTAFWTSTATQILDDYEGYFIPHPYAPANMMLPVGTSGPSRSRWQICQFISRVSLRARIS